MSGQYRQIIEITQLLQGTSCQVKNQMGAAGMSKLLRMNKPCMGVLKETPEGHEKSSRLKGGSPSEWHLLFFIVSD
jgi:hypothetical protein